MRDQIPGTTETHGHEPTALATAVEALALAALPLTDEQLGDDWAWQMYDEEGRRFALLQAAMELRSLAVGVEADRVTTGPGISLAQRIVAQHQIAFRDLHGLVVGLPDQHMDQAPAADEWPVREAIGHMMEVENAFTVAILGSLRGTFDGVAETDVNRAFDEASVALGHPEPAVPAGGTRAVLAAAEALHRRVVTDLVALTDEDLDVPSRFWEDVRFPVRFRMHRYAAHLSQHTIQVEKTLAALGQAPTESRMLVRDLYRALGTAEAALLGAGDTGADRQATLAGSFRQWAAEISAD